MTNVEAFKENDKYSKLTPFVIKTLEELDSKLVMKEYLYKAVWRDDKESGGNVFIFEVERKKGRRKNLITLRPQHSFLRVEVYWKEDDKHYFDIYDLENLSSESELLSEIDKMYSKIAF